MLSSLFFLIKMEIPKDILEKLPEKLREDPSSAILRVRYKNWKGETLERNVLPLGKLEFKSTTYHPTPQWILPVYDLDKKALRDYALADIEEFL
jgi:hypothetical protein